jgi:hypothetical protein
MLDVNYLAIVVATVAVFVLSSVWYSVFAKQLAELHPAYAGTRRMPVWKVVVELLRSFVVAMVLAGVTARLGVSDWTGALLLGFVMWIGFPVVLWTGAAMWENVPAKLAAIHAGDWLLKLLVISVIVSVWR